MKNILLTALIAAIVAFAVVRITPSAHAPIAAETGFNRVTNNGVLRCGYGTWEPGVYKNLQTGEMDGLFVELINAVGKLNGIKIEWAQETDWGQIAEAIKSGKIDAFCAGMAADAARGKVLAYTNPLSYWSFDVLVRADDTRFPGPTIAASQLNNAAYSTAYTEGDVLETIAKTEFPDTKGVPLPPLGTPADNLMNVATHKTDFVVFPKIMFQSYDKKNPGILRDLKIEPALRVYGNVIAVGLDDLKLQQLLNAGINELVSSGTYHAIMMKYDSIYPGAFLPVAPAYQLK